MKEGLIELEGMHFRCCHGCFDWEKTTPQDFVVDVSLACDIEAAAQSDDLKDTIDYGAVYDEVAKQMSVPANLLEHLASRIAESLSASFPSASGITVSVSKINPPVPGQAERSRVTVRVPGQAAGPEVAAEVPRQAAGSKMTASVPGQADETIKTPVR